MADRVKRLRTRHALLWLLGGLSVVALVIAIARAAWTLGEAVDDDDEQAPPSVARQPVDLEVNE